jgi:microcystin-dependent protein
MAFPQYTLRSYSGSAVATTLTSTGLGATYGSSNGAAFYVNNAQTWLENNAAGGSTTNALGTSGPFVVAVDYGTANEEKVLCSLVNLSNGQVTVWTDGTNNGRGYDGSQIVAHTGNAVCVPVMTAAEAREFNYAVEQTVGQIATAGDLLVGNGANSLARIPAGISGTVLTSQGAGNALTWTVVTNPPGTILDFAGSTAPAGYLLCDGTSYSTTTYAALYTALGGSSSPWGVGSGTFKVPDLRGRTTVAAGSGSGLTTRSLAGKGGAESVTLTAAQSGMPSHGHAWSDAGHTHNIGNEQFPGTGANFALGLVSSPNLTSSQSGTNPNPVGSVQNAAAQNASASHENMMPFAVVNKIIKY